MTLIITKHLVRIDFAVMRGRVAYFWWCDSRTIEWEDAEWECGDPPWPEFFQENAL